MRVYKYLSCCIAIAIVGGSGLLGQEVPPEGRSSIRSPQDAKAYLERILREVEAGTTLLVPFEVKTVDGKTMALDEYFSITADKRPKILEPERIPVPLKDIELRLRAAKVPEAERTKVLAEMVADSKIASKSLKARLTKIEQALGKQPDAGGGDAPKLPDGWIEFTHEKARFKVALPTKPKMISGRGQHIVSCTLGRFMNFEVENEGYRSKKFLLEDVEKKVPNWSFSKIAYGDFPGREIGLADKPFVFKERLYAVGDRSYKLSVSWRIDEFDGSKYAEAFFNSFQLLDETGKPIPNGQQKSGTTTETRIFRGEVVEVTGDKVRVSLKGKDTPQIGDPVKITYEIAGTDIKADVAKGKVAKVEPGFATVDITKKTAEIRKGYLAEIISSTSTEPNDDPDAFAKAVAVIELWLEKMPGLAKILDTVKDRDSAKAAAPRIKKAADEYSGLAEAQGRLPKLTAKQERHLEEKYRKQAKIVTILFVRSLITADLLSESEPSLFAALTSKERKQNDDDKRLLQRVFRERADISGRWEHSDNTILTISRDAKQQYYYGEVGAGNPHLQVFYIDDTVLIPWRTDAGRAGIFEWVLEPGDTKGTLKTTVLKGPNRGTLEGTVRRLEAAPVVKSGGDPNDLTGEWTNNAPKDEPLFNSPVKTFRLEKTPQGTFKVPGSDSNAHVRIVKDEPRFISHSGGQLATGTVERDPKTGAVVRIQWSAGSTWTRHAQPAIESGRDLAGEWTMAPSKDTAFGPEYTGPKTFRLEKTATPGLFRNPGSSNSRVVFAKDELHFFNNAGNKTATAKIEVDPKIGAIERIEWSDGSVFTRKGGPAPVSPPNDAKVRDAWRYKVDDKDGWFKKGTDKKWVESAVDGVQLQFAEVARTAEFVELFDNSREMSVRLFADHMQWRQGKNIQWTRSPYVGNWIEPVGPKKVETLPPKTLENATVLDLSGRWEESVPFGKAIWTLKRRPDGRYDAEQKGLSNASGIGALTGDRLKIDWKTGDGEFAGYTEMTLNEKRDAGKGKSVIKKDEDSTLPSTFKRLDMAAGETDKADLSGRWEGSVQSVKVTLTLTRRADGQYDIESDNRDKAPQVWDGAKGVGVLTGDVFKGHWMSAKNQYKGSCECTLDASRSSGKFTIKVEFSDGQTGTFAGQVKRLAAAPTLPEQSSDVSGRWRESFTTKGLSGKFEWTLTRRPDGRYDVQGTGSGKCLNKGKEDEFYVEGTTSVATVVGDTLKFSWKAKEHDGFCQWDIGPKFFKGLGKNHAYIYGDKFEFESGVERVGDAPPPVPKSEKKTDPNGLSGRWEDRDNSLALTLNRRADGLYEVQHIGIKEFGNEFQGKGLGQLVGDTLKIDFYGGGRFRSNKGSGAWKLDARRGRGEGTVVIHDGSKEKKEDSRYSSVLVRLDFAPDELKLDNPKKEDK